MGINATRLQGALTWQPQVQESAKRWGIDWRWALAVLAQESGGNQNDISPAGAIGLMQLMPGTAAALGVDPYDPVQNIDGGVRYLSEQLKSYNGDVTRALQAYNAGPGNVNAGNIPDETKAYVPAVKDYYQVISAGAWLNDQGKLVVHRPGPPGIENDLTIGADGTLGPQLPSVVPDDWKKVFTADFWKQAAVWIVLVVVGLGTVYVAVQSLAKGGETA